MSTCLTVAITGSLLLVLQGSSAAVEVTETRLAAAGSSVLMHAPNVKSLTVIEWEYIRNTTPEFILQYYLALQTPTIYPAYQGRVVFYPKNGSVLLQRVQKTDSGIYKATVDLMQHKARTTLLKVIKPVPQPELQCSLNLAGSPVNLSCMVPEGTVDSISWKKEGLPLPPEKFLLLFEDMSILQPKNGEKLDCGSYSCNVSNSISWKEATLTLTGLTPPLLHVQRLVIVTLMFIAVSATSFIFLLCRLKEPSSEEEACKHIILFIHLLLCVASILLLVTSIIWMQEEGLSPAFILLGLFFFVAVIGTGRAAVAAVWRPAALVHLRRQMWYRVVRNSTAPTTLIVNFLFSIHFLHDIQQLHAKQGCSETVDLLTSCVPAAAAIVLTLLLLLLWYHWRNRMVRGNPSSQTTQVTATSVIEPQGLKQEGQ